MVSKLLYSVPLGLVLLAQVLRLLHWPFSSEAFLLGIFCQVVLAFGYLFNMKNEKGQLLNKIKPFVVAVLYFGLMTKLMFWKNDMVAISSGVILAIALMVSAKVKKEQVRPKFTLMIWLSIFSIGLMFIPNSRIFSGFEVLDLSGRKDTSHYYWMNYSELLYQDGRIDESLKANLKSQEIVCNGSDEIIHYQRQKMKRSVLCDELKSIEVKIKSRTW
jgi:hypothetical protein